ncbi:MAG: hypothetical protein WCX88_01775 [Patescibacteria group bacterium]
MAKVSGPLMSMSASGKIGDAIVFAAWKGVAYVRQFVIPANPQSSGQGDNRIILGGTGRACGKVGVTSPFNVKLSAKAVIPAGQSKQSYLVKYILAHYLDTITKFTAELAAVTAYSGITSWNKGADNLGITAFDLGYAAVGQYAKALGLTLIYKTQQALGFTGSAYTPTLATMTATKVHAFITTLKSV